MTEKLIPYRVNGEMFDVPESSREKFEKRYPSATIEMHVGDEIFDVPFAQEGAFIKRYPDAVYGLKPSETNPEEISSPVSIDDVEMNRKERRQARREERANDDKTSLGETLVKSTGAAGTRFAKQALDLGRMAWNSSAIGGAINMLTGNSYDEKLQDEDNLMTQWSTKLGETADRLSLEADPTGGKEGYLDLIKQGRLGTVLQKAVGSGIESLPMMLAASNPLTAVAYGAAMAESEYADETRENPEVAAWKRRVNATGQAALELAIERLGGPFKAKGKLTKEALEKFLGEAAKEGAETIAKRIFKGLGGVLKEGGEEGLEELGTSFGNDILGTALDAVDGNADYGIRAQWEQAKAENPNLTLGEFAKMKGEEYIDSFIGGAVSGMEISGAVGGARKGYSLIKGETRNAVQAARDNGANLDYADMYDTDALVAESATALEGALVDKDGNPIVDRAFIDNISADEAYALAGREDFSNEQRKAFFDYAVAKAQYDGLNEKLDNRLNEQIEGVRGRIEEATDDNGLVIVGTLNGKAVYVKDGFITIDGRVATGQTDTGYTFGPVIVVDSVTGEKTTVTGDQIQSASSHVASELFGGMEAAFREKEANDRNIARNTVSPRAKLNTVMGLQNRKMLVDLGNGLIEVEVMKVDPKTGEVMIKGKKGDLGGQAITKLGTDVFYDSLYRDENGEFAFVDDAEIPVEPEDAPTDIPVAPETPVEEGPVAEAPAVVTETPDYRGETFTILQNGVPVEAEVVSQDDASDTVVYRIIGENGQPMLLSSTIGEFGSAIEAAATQVPVAPKVETEPEVETVPETPAGVETAPEAPAAPIEPEAIDWDALFDSDPKAYFAELQNQFGEEALDILNEEIEAAQNELDALAKAKTKSQNERLENRKKKQALQNRIDALNGMVARVAPSAAPASPEVAPEVPQGVENVPDFSIDKASEARKRGFRMTNGQRVDRRGETSGVYGKDIEVTFTSESKGKRAGKVKVIEAESLVPSHIRGVENVYHFLPEAQPKKRTDAASTVSATLIAKNMDSAKMTNVSSSAYEGAPSVNKRGEAIQGNNRAAAIIEMYQAYPEKAAEYKQYLIDHSAEFGIDAATVAAMQNPVLVRELDVDDIDAIALGQHTMQDMESGGSQMIDSGRAIAGLSNKGLLEEFIARLLAEENEEASDMNLNDLITRNGNDAIKMLYHNGIINQTQYQSALGPNGKITADARAALRGIIEQQLFANGIDNLSVMFEVLPDKAKKAIMQTIARDLKNPEDSKVTPYIQEAIEIYYQLNKLPDFVSAKTDAEIDSAIESFKAQTSLDQDGVPAEKYTNFAFVLARNFKAKTQKQQRELLNYLYDTIEGTADIFGESEGKSLGEAVAEVYNTNLNKAKDETDEEGGDSVLEGGTGEGPEGRQGSTGGVGVRPTTGEGGQGAGNGGTNTTFGGGVGSEGEVGPKAPKPVDNPVAEAQKKEKSLAIQLKRIGIPHEQKQDMAFNAGKAVADFFATREEYEAYAENATDFGEYNADFERGVDASFANRPQNTGGTPGNSVPLENEPKGEDNGKANEPETEDTEGRVDRIGSEPANDEGSEESGTPSEEVGGSEADNTGQVEDKYPVRNGDVTPQILKETFGMRDVASDISTNNLNSIYDFMMEMAKILGISPKSIGHGATLGAENYNSPHTHIRAQYSYRQAFDGTVKNPVLRFRNAALSSIAHEWWHSLDTALAYYETGKTHHTATNSNDSNFTGRAETLKAIKDVLKAINKSGHKDRLNIELANNPSYMKYSKQKDEMSARAFEEYILMKFAEAGIEVDTHTAFFSNRPNAEEMKVIAPAFDKLFEVLQEKEGKTPGTSVLFQIGQEVDEKIEENNISEVARKIANEAIDMMFEQAGREVVFVTDEQAEQMRKLAGADAEFMISSDKPVFVSNAAVAVMGIKQEKATPAQWLAMIEKAGGLKAGEDKWMGLSDWLKESDKKTLTKQEVLEFVNEHMIKIEEQHYSETGLTDDEMFEEYIQSQEGMEHVNYQFSVDAEEFAREQLEGQDLSDDEYEEEANRLESEYYEDDLYGTNYDAAVAKVREEWKEDGKRGVRSAEREINETRMGYTTYGLDNYKEIALVVPTIESWNESDEIHFGDAGNGRAVAWVRFGETTATVQDETQQRLNEIYDRLAELEMKVSSSTGITHEEYEERSRLRKERDELQEIEPKTQRVLVIDEIQSKRHQEGREQGYKVSREKADAEMDKFMKQMHDKYDFSSSTPFAEVFNEEEMREFARLSMQQHGATFGTTSVPAAPFEKNWHELAMKRMLRYAAEHGYDAVAWTKGEQQAERYGIAKVVKDIYVAPSDVERYVSIKTISGDAIEVPTEPNSDVIVSGQYKGQRLSDVVGKELADKILSVPEGTDDYISGDDLKVGGEGMKGFYDKMLPAFMNKYGKKWGIKVADITLPNVEEAGRVMHSVPITDAMKESVMEGQVMFMKRPNGKVFGWTDGKKIYLTKDGLNPNTKIHEYTHLWAQAMMQKNPKGWQSVKDLLRGTPVWNEVLNDPNYSNIHADEDLVASEVLSRISGRDGSAKLERMAQQMVDEAKGSMRKLEARGLVQRIKDALNEFWNWVGTELFGIEKFESVEQVTDRVLWDLMNATDLGELYEGQVETQIVTDPKVIAELEASPKRTGYRNVVQNEDGSFSSPMAYWLQSTKGGAKTRVETAKFELGKWEEAEEHPELVDENGHVTLVKPNKSTVEVAYDPYIHNRLDPVNLQFKDAWKRDELVYVETEVPETDLESGYHADKALLPVGVHSWSNGDLILSKYDKPVRIMPWESVADAWVERLNGEGVHFDVVPPALRPLLVERGVEILPPHKGMGKDCFDAYDMWKENPDIRYRFVGEQGAMRIDAATKSTWMLDGLAQARRMEGKFNAKEIKRATGWERGTDGKWRYEEPDNLSIKEDKAKELYDAFVHNREIELGVRPKSEGYKIDVFRLEDVLDAPELYRAYPEFKDMRIRPKMLGGANGIYRGNIIDIHGALFKPSYKGELEDVLLHELQHAIQVKEGFIEGTDASNGWDNYINNAGEVEARNVVARKNMSYAERKLRLASETEDVAREDQIIITNGLLSTDPAYLKSDTQNAAVDYLAGEPRLRAIENAVNEEASKLGVKVTYKTREQMPNGHQNDKGYYDPKTGEVVVCTENATSIADAIQTILHEAVAHKGLRQLMGDKFNEFINRVYDSLDAETKAKVDALAESQYNGNKAVAMEEYMATLAESTDFKKDTLWDKIKSIFEDIINGILGRNDIKIGDNELRYILRASYNNMVNPRGMETMRGWAQDQMMREEYKINDTTPDILSRTGIDPSAVSREAAKSVYDKVVNDTWQEMQRQFQDAYQPVRIAIDAIQQETGNIPIEDYENYLLIQNQSSSRSRVEIDEFAERYYSPIVEQVNKIIDTIMESRGWKVNDADRRAEVYAELKQYLIAKHGLERNEYYQTHKMRNLTAAEKRKEKAIAKQAYDTEVANINADTTLTDAERELQLRDAKDTYDAAILEINTREVPDIRDYSGLTSLFGLEPKKFRQAEAEARNLVDNAENMFGPELDILWERINKATDKTLRHSYESGIISRQQYNDIKDMFEFYIPLRGFEDITAEDIYSYARFEGNRFSAAVQTAKGRTSVANDPLAYIMSMAESEITQGNKNRAKQALYNYLLNRTQTDSDGNQIQNSLMQVESVWYVKSVDPSGNTVMTMAAPDHASGETYEEFEARMEALAAIGDAVKSKKGKIDIGMRFQKPANMGAHYVHLKVNGVDKAIYINGDPKAADAINGTYKKERNELSEAMGKWNRFLSSMFTNYSLEFTVRNYFRDMLYSHINIGVKESDPAYRKKFRQNWRHNNFRSMVKMLKAFRAGEYDGRALTEDEAAFVEFMKNGGQTGYVVLNKVETHRAELEKAIERMQNGLAKGGVKDSTVFKYTLGGIELLNEASELVTRFAAFKTSRDMGRSVVQSISDAKEVTVNFNTKGAQDGKGFMGMIAHYFGWSKYFFNASMQGVQNLKAMANAKKLKFGGVVGGIVATGFLMPIITGAIAQLLGGDEEEYWNIPEYDRQNNFCIPVGNGKYAKIPLPVGFREVYAIGDMVSAMMFDKKFTKDVKSVGTDIANKIASIVLPINPLEGTANGLSIWHTLAYTAAPSSAQLLIQNLTNTDWKGAPLQKEYTYNENDPQWMKAFAGNPDWMQMLSKWCNEHINADGDYKGWDWSPEKLDNTLSNLFGGVYTLIKKTGKSISMIWNEENRNMQNAPVAGVFLGSGIDSDDRFVTDAYYEMMDYYDSQVGYIKRNAARFGYDLDEVFKKEKGKHHPKMNEIYSNKNFDFMQEWYKGNEDLEKLNDKIKRLEKKIAGKENPTQSDLNKLARLKDQLAVERREFVDDMLELD